jgi:hypothetical protein
LILKRAEKLNELVSDAMKDIQEEIDLQSLVNDAMAEFGDTSGNGAERAEKQRQQEKERQDSPNRNDRSQIKAGHSHDRQDFV